MTQSSSMTCEVLEESACRTSPMSMSPSQLERGSGSRPLTGTNLGPSRWSTTAGVGMTSRRSSPPRITCETRIHYELCCTHIHFWNLSMEKPERSSAEEERLKKEIDTLRRRIKTLAAENQLLRQKLASVWGE